MPVNKSNLMEQIKLRYKNVQVDEDKALTNKEQSTSITMKGDGTTNIIGGDFAQVKCDAENGNINEISTTHTTITVQKNIMATDINVNHHKLNSQLYELTDYKQIGEDGAIGGMTMSAYVMVKTWEPNLQKYVMIRRLARVPMFSYLLNSPKAPNEYEVDQDGLKDAKEYRAKLDKELKEQRVQESFESKEAVTEATAVQKIDNRITSKLESLYNE